MAPSSRPSPQDLVTLLSRGGATLLTGSRGIGKTHTLRGTSAALRHDGRRAPLLSGGGASTGIPLGAFAGVHDLSVTARNSPAGIVDAFARDRSARALLVDDVEGLDEASLFVICQLVATTRIPTVLVAQTLIEAPAAIRRLYDSGDLTEAPLGPLDDDAAARLVTELLGGDELTPKALSVIVATGEGNPLHLREIVRGSVDDDRLVETPHGWDLAGPPTTTARLSQLLGARFDDLDDATLESAARIAIAGELPRASLDEGHVRSLLRIGVVDLDETAVRVVDALDVEHLRSRLPEPAWRELARSVVDELRTNGGHAAHRAVLLSLDHGVELDLQLDLEAAIGLAEHALGAHDPRLALRAASAVVAERPEEVRALRTAGLAASTLGELALAESFLDRARATARSDEDVCAAALARAQHVALVHHDAAAACATIDEAIAAVSAPAALTFLYQARMRWGAVAGLGVRPHATDPDGDGVDRPAAPGPDELDHPEAAMGLIAGGVAAVISGPLEDASMLLEQLADLPAGLLDLVPGGRDLIGLTEIMALSYTGDVLATRRRLEEEIAAASQEHPESLGMWEYALGVVELFSADAARALDLARSATTHLAWRDHAGTLPAAQALAGAAAVAQGHEFESIKHFEAIAEAAAADPKVVMLRGWAKAWERQLAGRPELAAQDLVATARSLLDAQHVFLAGMIAHCAVRLDRRTSEATEQLATAARLGGGGLLTLLSRHATAVQDRDLETLVKIAVEAAELGLDVTAADTWALLAAEPSHDGSRARQQLTVLRNERPHMALWLAPVERPSLLTERERQVAELAAQRLTAKEIAQAHSVSVHTVNNQLAAVFRKLGIRSRAELREIMQADA